MNVASLFAKLGLNVDQAAFTGAEQAIERLRVATERLATESAQALTAAATAAQHFDRVVLETSRAGRGAVEDATVSWDGWNKGQKKAIEWGKVWDKTLRGARNALIGGFVIVHAVKGIASLGDAYTGAGNRIRQLTSDTERQKALQDALFKSAQDTATGFGDQVSLFQQIGKAAEANGRTLEQGVAITDTLTKAIQASGATADGARAALLQLGQGLGANALRGEEFNSVIEQAPFLIDILAKDLGKTRGEMRKMAEGGKLTAKVVLGAFERQKGAVDEAFAKRVPLISDGFTRLRNEVEKTFGQMLADKKTAEAFSDAISGVGKALIILIKIFAASVRFFATHQKTFYALLVALTAAFVSLKFAAASAWIAAFGPIVLAIALVAALALSFEDLVEMWIRGGAAMARGLAWVVRRLEDLGRQIRRAFSQIGEFFAGIARAVRQAFADVFDWIEAKIDYVLGKIKGAIDWLRRNTVGRVSDAVDTVIDAAIGGGGPTASVAPAVRGASDTFGGGTTIENTINVQAANEPGAVASATTTAMQAFWDSKMRGTGIA